MLLVHWNMRKELSRNWVIQLEKPKLCKMAWKVNHWWIKKWDSLKSELKSKDDLFCARSFSLVSFLFLLPYCGHLRLSVFRFMLILLRPRLCEKDYQQWRHVEQNIYTFQWPQKRNSFQSCGSYQVCQLCACRTFLSHVPHLSHKVTFPQN